MLGVNLWGVVHGIRAFVPHLVEQDEGHVVNTASIAGFAYAPMMGPYNAPRTRWWPSPRRSRPSSACTARRSASRCCAPAGSTPGSTSRTATGPRRRPGSTTSSTSPGREMHGAGPRRAARSPPRWPTWSPPPCARAPAYIFTGDEWIGLARARFDTVLDRDARGPELTPSRRPDPAHHRVGGRPGPPDRPAAAARPARGGRGRRPSTSSASSSAPWPSGARPPSAPPGPWAWRWPTSAGEDAGRGRPTR